MTDCTHPDRDEEISRLKKTVEDLLYGCTSCDELRKERDDHLVDLHRQNLRVEELVRAASSALSGSGHNERCPQSPCEGHCNCWRSFLVDALASPAEDP